MRLLFWINPYRQIPKLERTKLASEAGYAINDIEDAIKEFSLGRKNGWNYLIRAEKSLKEMLPYIQRWPSAYNSFVREFYSPILKELKKGAKDFPDLKILGKVLKGLKNFEKRYRMKI